MASLSVFEIKSTDQTSKRRNMKYDENRVCCFCCIDKVNPREKQQRDKYIKPNSNGALEPHRVQNDSARLKSNEQEHKSQPNTKRHSHKNSVESECAKCRLIVDWTLAQAKLASKMKQTEPPVKRNDLSCPECDKFNSKQQEANKLLNKTSRVSRRQREPESSDEAEISSLTESNPGAETIQIESSHIRQQQQHQVNPTEKVAIFRRIPMRLSAKLGACRISARVSTNSKNVEGQARFPFRSRKRRQAPKPPEIEDRRKLDGSHRLLDEQEVSSLEHSLKAHKSSVYVAGCLANLYLTKTRLIDNGRLSSPENDSWQLKQVGVPVLTFDSGLARNRRKRQLKVNLAERESGFVLWSDTIDHLSNYRAYEHQLTTSSRQSEKQAKKHMDSTFHVMYISTDHRLMAGLAFDDATCARLFLSQIELVTSDPRNISLTGPKQAQASGISVSNQSAGGKARSGLRGKVMNHLITNRHIDNLKMVTRRQVDLSQNTWSTLKRAMRLTQSESNRRNTNSSQTNIETFMNSTTDLVVDLFRPKPLAELAASGNSYGSSVVTKKGHKGIKVPRKCDISAPCLFQHVTRISQAQLNGLRSGHLLNSTENLGPETPTSRSVGSICEVSSDVLSSSSTKVENYPNEAPGVKFVQDKTNQTQDSLSSSCGYSSGASISPPSSECESRTVRSDCSGDQRLQVKHRLEPRERSQQQPENGSTNIQAVIRELESQAPAEMVSAKRRLIADIAGQFEARKGLGLQSSNHSNLTKGSNQAFRFGDQSVSHL